LAVVGFKNNISIATNFVVSNLPAKPHKKVVSNTLNGVECYHDTHRHKKNYES
tara:strand:+ start:558 stop:716 length:159 start_codon:yes stop_codon:yes gene_type:complete